MRPRGCTAVPRWVAAVALLVCAPWPWGAPETGRAALAQASDSGGMCGIGAVVGVEDSAPTIMQVRSGGAAAKEGELKAGDVIDAVAEGNGAFVNCEGLTVDKVVAMIRGKKGTTVRLKVISGGTMKIVSLVRAEVKIDAPPVEAADADAPEGSVGGLSKDDKAKLADYEQRIGAAVRKAQADDIGKMVDEIVATTGADENVRKALEKAAAAAVAEAGKEADTRMASLFKTEFEEIPLGQAHKALTQLAGLVDAESEMAEKQLGVFATDMPSWKTGLKAALTPAQEAMWEAAEAKKKQEVEGEIGDYLDHAAKMSEMMYQERVVEPAAEEVLGEVTLPKERADQVRALEKKVVSEFGDEARAKAEKALTDMSEEQRKETVARANGYFEWLPPMSRKEWDDALAKVLLPEDLKAIAAAKKVRADQLAAAMGKLLLALMDQRVALTSAQRQQLEPITTQMVKDRGNGSLGNSNLNNFYNYSLSGILAKAGTGGGVKAILDPIQLQHWEDASEGKGLDQNQNMMQSISLPEAGSEPAPSATPEPDEVELAISHYMEEKSAAQREKVLGEAMLNAEDAARVLRLPADVAQLLKTAACGSADESMSQWSDSTEGMVRSYLAQASPDTVEQRLACVPSYQFNRMEQGQDSGGIWEKAVKMALNEDQQKAWQAEREARDAYRSSAIAGWIACSFGQNFGLSQDQTDKIQGVIGKLVDKYHDRLGGFFMGDTPWYLESFYMFIPVAGIPDKDLKGLLTKEQLEKWNGSPLHSEAAMMWGNISR